MTTTIEDIKAQLDELQMWFARKPYGWYDKATAEQRQMWIDREQEQDRLICALEEIQE